MRVTGAPVATAAAGAAAVVVGPMADDDRGLLGDGGGNVEVVAWEAEDVDAERAGEGEEEEEVVVVGGSVAVLLPPPPSKRAFILSVLTLAPGTMTDLGRVEAPGVTGVTWVPGATEYGRGAAPPTMVVDLARLPSTASVVPDC